MKKLLYVVIAIVLLCGFRAPNGNIISKGEMSDKLLLNLGQPHVRTDLGTIQMRAFGGLMFVKREIWTYRIDDYNYRFVIQNGQIVDEHWTRF